MTSLRKKTNTGQLQDQSSNQVCVCFVCTNISSLSSWINQYYNTFVHNKTNITTNSLHNNNNWSQITVANSMQNFI